MSTPFRSKWRCSQALSGEVQGSIVHFIPWVPVVLSDWLLKMESMLSLLYHKQIRTEVDLKSISTDLLQNVIQMF